MSPAEQAPPQASSSARSTATSASPSKALTLPARRLRGSPACLNCGTPLKGPFCYYCGQPDKNLVRFFPALVRDVLEDFIDLDSRVVRTLKPLLLHPGKLTRDYLDGRRFRYTPPLRLYIFSSMIFFVLAATLAGSATAGTDYTMVSDLITITAGSISETITIPITGDALDEDDETLSVVLSSPVNATLSANSQGQATITDDDDPPAISIEDVTVTEGDSGTTTAVFTIGLTQASGKIIVVSINSSDITATAGQDYTAVSTSRAFNPGDPLTQTISVAITGDKSSEEDETFWLTLSNPGNVTLAKSQAIGTILDDDGVFLFLPYITSP